MTQDVLARPPHPPGRAVRLVAIDLDGTLLDDRKQVSNQTVDSLRVAVQRGVTVVIASARPPRSVRAIYERLGLDTLQINYNGALIWDQPRQQAVFHRPLDGALVRRMAELSRDFFDEVLVTCEILDRWYTDRFDQSYTTETGRLFRPDVVAPLAEFCNQPVTKLLLLGRPEVVLKLESILLTEFADDVAIVRTDNELLQIMHKSVNKAAALRLVAGHYGVAMANVMAIGDAPNDVEMLSAAGIAVAMDNAHPLCKQVAHWVAPSNNDHGVRAAIQRYVPLE